MGRRISGLEGMLLHIRPRLYSRFKNVFLVDLEFRTVGLRLTGGIDLVTRRPYPNKGYAVACRKKGHMAVDGILVETPSLIDELHYTARWAVEASTVVTHHVHYKLLDHDFRAASDSMMLWHGYSAELGGWSSRMPAWVKERAPLYVEPLMEVEPPASNRRETKDTINAMTGWIVNRDETFAMPTIERERILNSEFRDRLPGLESVFRPSC